MKNAKIKNLLKTKRTLKPKYKLSGGRFFTISLPGWVVIRASSPRQLCHWQKLLVRASLTMNG